MPSEAEVRLHRAEMADIPVLVSHHRRMFEEIRAAMNRPCGLDKLAAMDRSYGEKLGEQMPSGQCSAWIALVGGEIAGSGGLSVVSLVPVPEDSCHRVGYFHSLYVEKPFRRMGAARAILEAAKARAAELDIRRIHLSASSAARSLYQSSGFHPMIEAMGWRRE